MVGRFEDFIDVITESVIGNDEVVIGVIILSDLFLLDLVIFIVIDEYEGEFLIICVVLFDEVCFDILDEVFGNSWCLVGVGGLIIVELEELFVFVFFLDSFFVDVGIVWVIIDCEFIFGN